MQRTKQPQPQTQARAKAQPQALPSSRLSFLVEQAENAFLEGKFRQSLSLANEILLEINDCGTEKLEEQISTELTNDDKAKELQGCCDHRSTAAAAATEVVVARHYQLNTPLELTFDVSVALKDDRTKKKQIFNHHNQNNKKNSRQMSVQLLLLRNGHCCSETNNNNNVSNSASKVVEGGANDLRDRAAAIVLQSWYEIAMKVVTTKANKENNERNDDVEDVIVDGCSQLLPLLDTYLPLFCNNDNDNNNTNMTPPLQRKTSMSLELAVVFVQFLAVTGHEHEAIEIASEILHELWLLQQSIYLTKSREMQQEQQEVEGLANSSSNNNNNKNTAKETNRQQQQLGEELWILLLTKWLPICENEKTQVLTGLQRIFGGACDAQQQQQQQTWKKQPCRWAFNNSRRPNKEVIESILSFLADNSIDENSNDKSSISHDDDDNDTIVHANTENESNRLRRQHHQRRGVMVMPAFDESCSILEQMLQDVNRCQTEEGTNDTKNCNYSLTTIPQPLPLPRCTAMSSIECASSSGGSGTSTLRQLLPNTENNGSNCCKMILRRWVSHCFHATRSYFYIIRNATTTHRRGTEDKMSFLSLLSSFQLPQDRDSKTIVAVPMALFVVWVAWRRRRRIASSSLALLQHVLQPLLEIVEALVPDNRHHHQNATTDHYNSKT